MTFETIEYEVHGAIAVLALNRPEKLNAITDSLIDELNRALDLAEADDTVRVVVLHGNGRAFSAGFDLEGGTAAGDLAFKRALLQKDFDIIMRFWDCPKPTIAAVHRYCLGGALEMALACDLTVASTDCRLGEPEPKFGSGSVALLLPWITGPKQAKELLLTADDQVTAERALELGLVNRVTPEGEHLSTAMNLARKIATLDQTSVRLTKVAINRSCDIMGMRQALLAALEIDVIIETTETEESREFNRVLDEQGLKAALAWREARIQS
jgi:enoyl-CoA hydratase